MVQYLSDRELASFGPAQTAKNKAERNTTTDELKTIRAQAAKNKTERNATTDELKTMYSETTNPKDRVGVNKVPLSLLPPVPQAHTAMALLDGVFKYTRWNWRSESVAASVYLDACRRHIEDWIDGEECASDSTVHHLGHACACLFIIMDAQACGQLVDDRPKVSCQISKVFEELSLKVKAMYEKHNQKLPTTPPIASTRIQDG